MHLHRILMGDRWSELPAETVLDTKVSKIIGNVVLVQMALLIAAGYGLSYYHKKSKETKK